MQVCLQNQDSSQPSPHNPNSPLEKPYCIHGDSASPLRVQLQDPFRNGVLTPPMTDVNRPISIVRESVERLFKYSGYFKFLDFKKPLKIGLSHSIVDKMYVVSTLLRNALTCLYGNQTSRFFQLDLPSLEETFVCLGQFHLS